MSTQTTNLKLIKPEMSDYANITDISNNFDILDKAYGDLNSEHADIRRMFNNYLPLTGGTVSGRTHIDAMLCVGNSRAVASNIRVDGAAGNAYMALLNYNNTNSLLIDGYFNNPETAVIDVTNRSINGAVRYRSTLIDGKGNAKFANDVYANNKLLATKEYVDGKKWGSTNITDGAITPTKLDRAYLPLTGGKVTGDTEFTDKLTNNGKIVGQLFDGSAEIKSILDWDKMKEVYGSVMTSTTTTIKGQQKTLTYPNWALFSSAVGVVCYYATNKDIYLVEDFTKYDELIFITIQSEYFTKITRHKTAQLNYMFENLGLVNLTDTSGDLVVYGYYAYGSSTGGSVRNKFKYYDDSCYIVDILGVNYKAVK